MKTLSIDSVPHCVARACFRRAVLLVVLLVTGCAQTGALKVTEGLPDSKGAHRVLLVPPDIELSLLTAGGLYQPRADWTATAETHVQTALQESVRKGGDTLVTYAVRLDAPAMADMYEQVIKLHEAVGRAILIHKYLPKYRLPTKTDKLDYSLGSTVRGLRNGNDADYALFIYLRDSYQSGGRIAASLVAAAVFGVSLEGGTQVGFASLVDLERGDVVWFNRLLRTTGDLRQIEPAREAVIQLLRDFPL